MRNARRTRLAGAVGALAAAMLLAACDNPASPGDHQRAYGVQVSAGAEVLVRALGNSVTGSLAATPGSQTGALTVRMLDRDGNVIEPRQGYWLRVNSQNSDVARWQQATAGEFGGTLVGVAAGQTSLEFCNMHGAVGRGHDDGCHSVTVLVAQP